MLKIDTMLHHTLFIRMDFLNTFETHWPIWPIFTKHWSQTSIDTIHSLMCLCCGREPSTLFSIMIDSVMASSWDLSMILTAYSWPVSREMHFLTVLERPLEEEGRGRGRSRRAGKKAWRREQKRGHGRGGQGINKGQYFKLLLTYKWLYFLSFCFFCTASQP